MAGSSPPAKQTSIHSPKPSHLPRRTRTSNGSTRTTGNTSSCMAAADPYDLERFVEAQDADGTYGRAVEELRRGQKTSHWMWFIFPQIAGLGQSQMSVTFAISSLEEAKAYLRHPVLGPRLIECAGIIANARSGSAEQIFGGIDAQKLHSSMT